MLHIALLCSPKRKIYQKKKKRSHAQTSQARQVFGKKGTETVILYTSMMESATDRNSMENQKRLIGIREK